MPFVKGKSGNPGGRPKRSWTWASLYEQVLKEKNSDDEPIRLGVARALVDKALQGDVLAIKELSNRMDGMPSQQLEADVQGKIEISIVEEKQTTEDE